MLLSKGEKNYNKAKKCIRMGAFRRAVYHLKVSEKQGFDKDKILLLEGIINLYKMKIAKAFEIFQRVLTFTKKNSDVYYYIGKCFVYFGNEEEAFDHFIKAYKNSNNEVIKGKSLIELKKIQYIDLETYKKVSSQRSHCLVRINHNLDEDYRSRAIFEGLNGNYLKSVEILKELVQKQPRNFEAFKDLAHALFEMGNYELALKSLKKAKNVCRTDRGISLELAKVFFHLKKYYEARREMRKTIKYFPPNYKNFYNMGNISSLIGRTTDAVSYYKKCIEINDNYCNAYFNIGTIFHTEGMLEEGENYYKKAVLIDNNRPEIHFNLGLLKYFKRNYFEALNHMLSASKLDPAYENALHNFKAIKNVKMLYQNDDFNETIPFKTKVLVTFIGIIIFLIIAYIVRLMG